MARSFPALELLHKLSALALRWPLHEWHLRQNDAGWFHTALFRAESRGWDTASLGDERRPGAQAGRVLPLLQLSNSKCNLLGVGFRFSTRHPSMWAAF